MSEYNRFVLTLPTLILPTSVISSKVVFKQLAS